MMQHLEAIASKLGDIENGGFDVGGGTRSSWISSFLIQMDWASDVASFLDQSLTLEKNGASLKHSIFSSQRRIDESRPSQSGNAGRCESGTLDDDVDKDVIIVVWA